MQNFTVDNLAEKNLCTQNDFIASFMNYSFQTELKNKIKYVLLVAYELANISMTLMLTNHVFPKLTVRTL